MLNWILVLLGMGPVQRAITARLKASIRSAEDKLAERRRSLEAERQAELEKLNDEYTLAHNEALADVVDGLLIRGPQA